MNDDDLDENARSFIDGALRGEPGVDHDARARMRKRMMGGIVGAAVGSAALATSGKALATTKVGATTTATATTTITGGLVAKSAIALVVLSASVVGVTHLVSPNDEARSSARSPAAPMLATSTSSAPLPAPDFSSSPVVSLPPPAGPASSAGGGLAAFRAAEPATAARSTVAPAPSSTSLPHPGAPRLVAAAPLPATPKVTAASDETGKEKAAFSEELALLERARRETSAGNHADALDALARMDRLPGAGAFVEEHDALRIVALCSSGRAGEGRDALTRFRGQFPRSLHTERVARACGE